MIIKKYIMHRQYQ